MVLRFDSVKFARAKVLGSLAFMIYGFQIYKKENYL